MINYYDYFFYKIYCIYLKKYEKVNLWHRLSMILLISIIEEMPLFVLILIILSIQSIVVTVIYFKIGLPVLLSVINGIYFLANRRWLTIIEKYKEYDNSEISRRMLIVVGVIVAVSFACLIYWKFVIVWKLHY